jgi:hypothetical protein
MGFGAKKHPIDRLGLRWIGQYAKWRLDRAVGALQRKPRQRLARARQDAVPSGGRETASRTAADGAKPHHGDSESLRLCPH